MTPERWERISGVYAAALAQAPEARDEFLAVECGHDHELRAEVASLLRQALDSTPAFDAIAPESTATHRRGSASGARLGHYRLGALIGEGGMGEVYRARDETLARDVAIKMLPPAFAADASRRARFEREARVLASFNHPHIAAIYGVAEGEGRRGLVLELVEGDTLAERLQRAAARGDGAGLPIPEALAIARQLVDALDAAHERGIVHRDLKPANIKITREGVVKVLDFGLATAVAGEAAAADLTKSPTITVGATGEGVILGTAPYMSPEQARGLPVDKRTDIWAFGCVLYEMLTGRGAFAGATLADTLAAIVERDPDWTALPAATPDAVLRLVRRCLEKDLARRLRDIGDAAVEIDDARAIGPAGERVELVEEGRVRRRLTSLALVAGALVVGGIGAALWLTWDGRPVSPQGATDSTSIFRDLTNVGESETAGAVSPDGKSVVFISSRGGTTDIWRRQISSGQLTRLTDDPAEEADLTYSPDGDNVYFTKREGETRAIWRVPALSGQPSKVLDHALKPAVSRDGRLAAVKWAPNGKSRTLWDITVTDLTRGRSDAVVSGIGSAYPPRPAWSPDGMSLAYSTQGIVPRFQVWVVDVASGQPPRSVTRLLGDPARGGQPAWLPDNRHVVVGYYPADEQTSHELGVIDVVDGTLKQRLTISARGSFTPSVSADGSRLVATTIISNSYEAWKVPLDADPDANGRNAKPVRNTPNDAHFLHTTRDGRMLLYNSGGNLLIRPVDGSTGPNRITDRAAGDVDWMALSSDGTRVAFVATTAGQVDIFTQNVDGSDLRRLTDDQAREMWPLWSPDGKWIAYISGGRPGDKRGQEEWRVNTSGEPSPERFLDEAIRGDWIRQPDGDGTWIVTAGFPPGPVRLIDVEQRKEVWSSDIPPTTTIMPMFSPDGRSVSATFETPSQTIVRTFETGTGKSRVVATLPFETLFRANWVDRGRALIVNKHEAVGHIVVLDHFWSGQAAPQR